MKQLGTPIGEAGFVDDELRESGAKYPHFLPRLITMDTQIALRLLRNCQLPLYTHHIRMLHPDRTRLMARELDNDIVATYKAIMHEARNMTANELHALAQPFRSVGVGLRSVERTAPSAYYDSRVQAIKLLAELVDPKLKKILEEFEALGAEESPPPSPSPPPPPPPPGGGGGGKEADELQELFGTPHPSPPASPHVPQSRQGMEFELFGSSPSPRSHASPFASPPSSPTSSQAAIEKNAAAESEGREEGKAQEEMEDNAHTHAHAHASALPSPAPIHSQAAFEPSAAAESEGGESGVGGEAMRAALVSRYVGVNPLVTVLAEAWHEVRHTDREVRDCESSCLPHTMFECFRMARGAPARMQRALTRELEDHEERERGRVRTTEERARARAVKGWGAKGACLAQPKSPDTTLPSHAMEFAVKYRLGTVVAPDVQFCMCGKSKPSVDHILSCRNLRGRFVRHDVISNVLASMLNEVGIATTSEVMVLEHSQKRMDVVAHLPTGRVWLDTSIPNPMCPAYLKDPDPKKTRAKAKNAKWREKATSASSRFVPFIVDTFGGIGEEAKAFLQYIAEQAYEKGVICATTSMEHAVGQYRWGLVQRIGVAIAHANQCMMEEVRVRATHPKAKTACLYKSVRERGKQNGGERKRARVYV